MTKEQALLKIEKALQKAERCQTSICNIDKNALRIAYEVLDAHLAKEEIRQYLAEKIQEKLN